MNVKKDIVCLCSAVLLSACLAQGTPRPSPLEEIRARLGELGEGLNTARKQFGRKRVPPATRFEEVKDKLAVIVCGDKAGSGFVVREGVVIAHRLDGTRLRLGARDEAVGRDMVRFALDESVPAFDLAAGVPDIGDPVVVLGNSDGRGVVTEIRGKVIGVGPREIEVDAAFVIGNSGSPVLDRHGRVIGIATYLRDCRNDEDWSKVNTRFNGIRRFALRLLGTRWARK